MLTWETGTERDNHYFTIERSFDAQAYEVIAQINGAGNSTKEIKYHYMDTQLKSGTYYYRLSQTDFNDEKRVFNPVV